MRLRAWKDRLLANPWVYDRLRPLVVGGLDLAVLARFCDVGPSDRVFDLGCGTAQLLGYLRCAQYLGVDLDAEALSRAGKFASPAVRFMQGDSWDAAYRELDATIVLMIGVVHHLSDGDFRHVIARLRAGGTGRRRIVAIDVSYFPGRWVNNLLSRLDRGRHVREIAGYESLYSATGLSILRKEVLSTRAGYVRYLGYHLGF